MKICLSSTGKSLHEMIDRRFGRCPYFIIVDTEAKRTEFTENTAVRLARGAGISAAQLVVDLNCEVVITGNVGPNAFRVLQASKVKVFETMGVSGEEALRKYNNGELSLITQARKGGCGFGHGGGKGYGRNGGPKGR
jgi:predicted Fe-Mo cluster-binding NifX family protein